MNLLTTTLDRGFSAIGSGRAAGKSARVAKFLLTFSIDVRSR
jgi:hypothetical protein